MLPWIQMAVTAVVSVMASSGFWAYWSKKHNDRSAEQKLLVGLAHDRILQAGRYFLGRGWMTHDDYENIYDYLYVPYTELGGNGTATRILDRLKSLPDHPPEEKGDKNNAS